MATVASYEGALDGLATLYQLQVVVEQAGTLDLLLVVPAGSTRPPVLLGLNKCGNSSILADDRVPLPTAPVDADCLGGATEEGRGSRAADWDLRAAVEAGWAVATVHQAEIAPDDRVRVWDGLAGQLESDPDAPLGSRRRLGLGPAPQR